MLPSARYKRLSRLKDHHPHLNPQLSIHTQHIYVMRKSILNAIRAHAKNLSGTLLDIGCGHQPYKPLVLSAPSRVEKYIGLDLKDNIYQKPDVEWDGQNIPLADNSIDCALAMEVLEHCPEPEVVLREALRVLKPGGSLFITVPFVWPLHDVPHDEYRYTPFALERHLRNAGFDGIEIKANNNWDASLAQMIGLWVWRRPMSSRQREILIRVAMPIVQFLTARDHPPEEFAEHSMTTSISATATKPRATAPRKERVSAALCLVSYDWAWNIEAFAGAFAGCL